MTSIDAILIETLLNMSESDVLDFKRDQYLLAGARDDQKGELVKDILAFANAWKTTDAHIVIGADENPGGRAVVVGVSNHLNDADIQQLVDPKKLVAYKREIALLNSVGFRAENVGRVLVEDARIFMEIPKQESLRVVDELPDRPRGRVDLLAMPSRVGRAKFSTRVKDVGNAWEVLSIIGKIQPNATVWSQPFWLGSVEEVELNLVARVYGDNIPRAIEVPVVIKIKLASTILEEDDDKGDEKDDE